MTQEVLYTVLVKNAKDKKRSYKHKTAQQVEMIKHNLKRNGQTLISVVAE